MSRKPKAFSFPRATDGILEFPIHPDGKRLCLIEHIPFGDTAQIRFGNGNRGYVDMLHVRQTLKLGDLII